MILQSIEEFKIRLQCSIRLFGVTTIAGILLTQLAFMLNRQTWIIGITPTVIVFGFIGLYNSAKTIIYLTGINEDLGHISEEEFIKKFLGVDSIIICLWFVFPAVLIFITSVYAVRGINLLTMSANGIFEAIACGGFLIFVLHELIEELAVSLFYISAVRSFVESAKEKRELLGNE